MMPTLQLRRTSLFWFQGAWELGRSFWRRIGLFLFVCLFVFQLPRWVIILVFKSHKWVRFSVSFLFLFLFCFMLFFLQNVQFPHHISRVRLIFLSPRLVKFFTFFYFCLFVFILFWFVFVFFLLPKIPPPLILYTDDGGHYVIDNFEFPCKNLIPIWNFTKFIQECKMIWEFQIRWGGTSLLRTLWRSWRYLNAYSYSLMSNRGRFQNFKNLIFFLHISVALL